MSEPVRHAFESAVLGNVRDVWIQPPAVASESAGLAIFLDGDFFIDHFGGPDAMAKVQREGSVPPTWSLYVSAGPREVRWPESFCDPDFASFVCDELCLWAEREVGGVRDISLIGVSLTGLSATHVALSRPGVFARVLSLSGSYWWEEAWLAGRVGAYAPADTRFRLTVGDQEVATDVDHGHGLVQVLSQVEGVQRVYDALVAHGFPVDLSVYSGGHDAPSWSRELPGDLAALWGEVSG